MPREKDKSANPDIREQLSDIQNRLFSSGSKDKSPRKHQENKLHRKHSDPLKTGISPAAASHNLVPQSLPSLGPESKGNDMNYVVGLSQNLVHECRRLNAENQKLKTLLKTNGQETETLRDQVLTLASRRDAQAVNETDLKDKNWELESMNFTLKEQLAELAAAKDKITQTMNDQERELHALQKQNAELTTKHSSTFQESDKLKSLHNKEIAQLNDRIQELNDENDKLAIQLDAISSKDTKAVSDLQRPPTLTAKTAELSDDDTMDFDSMLQDTNPHELLQGSDGDPTLEIETLKASLSHAHKTIAKLRSNLLKARFDTSKIPDTSSPIKLKTTKKLKIKPDTSSTSRSTVLSPSKRNSKFLVLENDSQTEFPTEQGRWEDFIGNDEELSRTNKRFSILNSTELQDSDEDDPIDKAREVKESSTKSHVPNLTDSESEEEEQGKIHNLNSELMNAGLSQQQVEDYARENNLVILPLDEYEILQRPDASKIEDSILIAALSGRGIISLSKKDYDDLLDETEMKKKLEGKGLVTVPLAELDTYKKTKAAYDEPDLGYLKSQAEKSGCEVIPTDELFNLRKTTEEFKTPSSAYLIERCKERNLVAITADKFDQLQHVETEHSKPSREYIKSKANELGLIVTPSSFHDELLQRANEPDVEHLVSKAETHGMTLIEKSKLEELENPSVESIKNHAQRNNITAIPIDEYNALYQLAHTPPVDHLKSKLEAQDHRVLETSAYNSLIKPSIASVIASAATLGFATLAVKELSDLKKSANEPSLSQVKTHAERLGLITLQKKEYLDLYKNTTEPSLEFLTMQADAKDYQLIKKQEFERLLTLSRAPSLEFLQNKASEQGFRLVDNKKYDSLTNPSLEEIVQKAGSLNNSVLETAELASLKQQALNPNQKQIEASANAKGFVVISDSDHKELLRKVDSPTVDELKSHAEKKNFSLVNDEELSSLKSQISNPTQEYLTQHASTLKHHLVPSEDWDLTTQKALELDRLNAHPIIEDIEKLGRSLGVIPIVQQELSKLQKLANEPPLEHISERAKESNMALVPNEEYSQLKELAHHPSKQYLKDSAASIGYEIIDKNEISKLRHDIANPSKKDVEKHAETHGLATIPFAELEQMKLNIASPSVAYLKQKAEESGQVLVSHDDYSDIHEKANNPTNSHLESKAKDAGFSLVPVQDFETLKRRADDPTVDELNDHASNQGHRVVPVDEYEYLLKLANDPPKQHLDLKAAALGTVLIDIANHEKLLQQIESPDKSYLSQKAASLNCSVIESDALNDLHSKLDKPSLEYLEEKAKALDMVLVPTTDWENKSQLLNNPQPEYIKDKASKVGLIAIDKTVWESTQKSIEQPSLEFLQSHVAAHDSVLITNEEYEHLKHPTKQEVVELAGAHEAVLVGKKEYLDLCETSSNPSVEHIRGKALARGFVLLESEKHQQLLDEVNDTSKAKLVEKAAAIGMIAVPLHKYEQMVKKIEEPTRNYLSSEAAKSGLVLVDQKEFENLRDSLEHPEAGYLTEKAAALGLVTIDKQNLEDLQNTVKAPGLDFLEANASKCGYNLVEKEEYRSLEQAANSPTINQLKSHSKALEHEILPVREYETMKETINNPTIEHLKLHAAKKEMSVVSTAEHRKLSDIIAAPSREHLEEKADSAGLAVVAKDDYSNLKATLANPSVDFLREAGGKLGFLLIESTEYESLIAQMESPDPEYLKKKSQEHQCVVVQKSEFTTLQDNYNSPSIDYLDEKAKSIHKVLLDDAEATRLRSIASSPDKDFLTEKASVLGLVLVNANEYSKLLEQQDAPSHEYLRAKAEGQKLTLLTSEEYDKLVDPDIDAIGQNAEKLGYTTIKQAELSKMKLQLSSPTLEYLKEKASSLDQVLTPKRTLDYYEALVSSPTKDDLYELATKLKMSVIDNSELAALKKKAQTPDEAHLKSVSKALGLAVIPDPELQALTRQAGKTIEEQAKEAGQVLLSEEEFKTLTQNSENPSLDVMVATAPQHGHIVIDKNIHNDITNRANMSLAERAKKENMVVLPITQHQELLTNAHKPSAKHVTLTAAALGLGLLPVSEIEYLNTYKKTPLSDLAAKDGKLLIDKNEFEALIQKADKPDVEHLSQKADSLNHIVIPVETHKKLLGSIEEPSLDYLRTNADRNGHLLVERNEFNTIKELSEKSIETRAQELSKTLIDTDEYTMLKDQIDSLQTQLDDPSPESLREKAIKHNMRLINADELAKLKTELEVPIEEKAKSLGYVAVTQSNYNQLLEKLSEPLEVKAANENKHIIDEEAFEELQKLKEPSESFISKHAGKIGLAILGATELAQLQTDALEPLESKALKQNKVMLPSEEHANLISPSLDRIRDHAHASGFELVDHSQLEKLLKIKETPLSVRAEEEGKVLVPQQEMHDLREQLNNPTAEYIVEKSKMHDMATIKFDELAELQNRAKKPLKELAEESQFKLLSQDEYDELLVEAKQPSIDRIKAIAAENGFKVVSEDEYNELNDFYLEPLDVKAKANGMVLVPKDVHEKPEKGFLLEKLSLLGLTAVSTAEYAQLKELSDEATESKAAKEGKVVLSVQDHDELMVKSSVPSVKEILKNLDSSSFKQDLEKEGYKLVPSMNQDNTSTDSLKRVGPSENIASSIIEARSRRISRDAASLFSLDNNFVDAEDSVYLDEEELALSAERIGMVVLKKDAYEELLNKKVETEDLEKHAKQLSLALLPEVELLQLKQAIVEKDAKLSELSQRDISDTKERIVAKLPEFNLYALDHDEYHNLKRSQVDSLTGDQIPSLAEKFGLNVVSKDEQNKLLEAQRTLEDDKLLSQAAQQKGFIMVPSSSFIATTAMREPDSSKVTVVPSSYYNKLVKNESLNVEKLSDEAFKVHAEKRGYSSAIDAVTPIESDSEVDSNVSPNLTPEVAQVAKMRPPSGASIVKTSATRPAPSTLPHSTSVRSNMSIRSHVDSINTGVLSMATNVSLTDQSMIPAITQVVIGEFLFKYYRRIGAFSSIAETRHERYFWVHPYSLTLYWSTVNPVLSNPAEVKTRAAAIVRVESVEDNNPLPTGLYHKSIIVHSQTRTIKITCPTRKRHNIWYNALRYMISRNMGDLEFEKEKEKFEDHDEEDNERIDTLFEPSAERHAFPRKRVSSTTSQIFRSSSTARLNRFSSMRRGGV